eukprot:c14656_g1_i1.p1 GENE.c14656_g1_i1~~c14656_g1_i1.p1  ORF type:complete len:668 (+),score=101.89 c14656_g1_i1:111-2006(+)
MANCLRASGFVLTEAVDSSEDESRPESISDFEPTASGTLCLSECQTDIPKGCSSFRAHGWHLAISDVLPVADEIGYNPIYTPDDGLCMCTAVVQSCAHSNIKLTDKHSDPASLAKDCEILLDDSIAIEFGALEENTGGISSSGWGDLVLLKLSEMLCVNIRIVLGNERLGPNNKFYFFGDQTSDRPTIVIFNLVNTHVTPHIHHYVGSRPLLNGTKASVPQEYLCETPEHCPYRHKQTEDEANTIAKIEIFQAEFARSKVDELGFHFASVYRSALGADIELAVGHRQDLNLETGRALLLYSKGSIFFRSAQSSEWVSFGRNWRLPIILQAGSLPFFKWTDWADGELRYIVSTDDRKRYETEIEKIDEAVRRSVHQGPMHLKEVADLYTQLLTSEQGTSLQSTPQERSQEPKRQMISNSIDDDPESPPRKPVRVLRQRVIDSPTSAEQEANETKHKRTRLATGENGPRLSSAVAFQRLSKLGLHDGMPGIQVLVKLLIGDRVETKHRIEGEKSLFEHLFAKVCRQSKITRAAQAALQLASAFQKRWSGVRDGLLELIKGHETKMLQVLRVRDSSWSELLKPTVPTVEWVDERTQEFAKVWADQYIGSVFKRSTGVRKALFIDCLVIAATIRQ